MIDNLKFGLKSFRYAYGIKSNVFLALAFLAAGMFMHIFGSNVRINVCGDFMIMCISMVPPQLICSLSASSMVQASPFGKKLQTSIPAMVTYVVMIGIYLIMTAYRLVRVWKDPALAGIMSEELVLAAVTMLIFMIYLGVAYKYFVVSMVMLIAAVMFFRNGWDGSPLRMALFGHDIVGVMLTALLGLGILTVGGFLQYLISLLVYRAPLSKMAQSATLRREL